MVSLVRETITFIQLQAKNSSKTAYTEKEKNITVCCKFYYTF